MALNIINHPLAKHLLTILRDHETTAARFREICKQLTYFLIIEATRSLDLQNCTVNTPLASCEGGLLRDDVAVVPIVRSGLTMLPAAFDIFEDIAVGYIGTQRENDHTRSYCHTLPIIKNKHVYILDPMLASGRSAGGALEMILARAPKMVSILSLLIAPEGVRFLENLYPDVPIFSIAVDERLNDDNFIVPGVGDFGERAYKAGTR